MAPLTSGQGGSWLRGVLCTLGCLAASLASTHEMPTASPSQDHHIYLQILPNGSWRAKLQWSGTTASCYRKKKKREKRQPRSLSLWPTELPWMQLSLCPACGQVPLTLPSFVSIPVSGLKRLSKEARLLHPDPRWGSHGWEGKPKVSWVWHPTPRTFCWRALSKDSTFICSFRSPAWRAALSALAFVRTWAISSLALLWKEGTKNTCLSSVMAWEPGC